MSRIFSIADIHGEADKLANLLIILKEHHSLDLNSDKIVFTGDYIDRGRNSYRVLELIYQLQREYADNVIALLGNHEDMMLEYHIHRHDGGLWHANGGKATERSFYKHHASKRCPGHLLRWLSGLPLSYVEDGFFFSHAPVYADYSGDREELIWAFRKNYLDAAVAPDGLIGVCGHIHDLYNNNPHPRFTEKYIFGDSGCGCDKAAPLCAINVRTREVVYSLSLVQTK